MPKRDLVSWKVYGALRMSIKMVLMWNLQLAVDGEGDTNVGTSILEASNLIVLTQTSGVEDGKTIRKERGEHH
ncbi:hypothetical protein M8C21_032863 [Ambrosia artemisiifolia]|uniref:Uncharacterized protein n=1 Tax=Ambrosia artemisiifolia TaxID=4212 RepID=A0AAD5CYP7_AMBAR|nr:hypothetical protein M8C21_032863 [Ambrosia artemisiifolia]